LAAKLDEVEAALLEQQETRNVLVDDVDLDGPDEWHALALHALRARRIPLAIALREIGFAVIRIRFEDQPGAALPFLDAERAGADGSRAYVEPCGFAELARPPPH